MYEPDEYTSEQVFYTSKDGTRIPMFISYKKGLELDGNNPAYLYGYGGFAVPIVPEFSFFTLTLMKLGFVVAFANLRGGGEYGEAWHELGMKANKQNVFDDFIASAEWLIANGYTNAGRLSINGVSNGGLLVAAAITQRPDLFKAAIVEVGVLDMLRFSKLEGSIWEPEYGSPDKEEDFQVLYAYSPQHRLQNGVEYPATMVMTGRYDDRVLPAHSCKFTAALQKAQGGDRPILLRVDDKSGHSGAHTEADIIEAITDRVAFLVEMLEVDISPLEK
jgi:prolyl oligopeptidase